MKKVDVKKRSIELRGRRFTQSQLHDLRQTVKSCTHLSRTELAHTLCEHLSRKSVNGKRKVDACLKALNTLAEQGVIELPAKRAYKKRSNQIQWTRATETQAMVQGDLNQLGLLRLQRVTYFSQRRLWNEWIDRYPYLGYQQPFGSHIRYFIVSETTGLTFGCRLFTSAVWAIAGCDRWIGGDDAEKHRRCLHRDDGVIYGRGYHSYALLYRHSQTGIHAVFRLKTDYTFIKPFFHTQAEETRVHVMPPSDKQDKIRTDPPEIKTCHALPMRLIKYTIEDKTDY